eukprot:1106532-Rhodomonas_salina.2
MPDASLRLCGAGVWVRVFDFAVSSLVGGWVGADDTIPVCDLLVDIPETQPSSAAVPSIAAVGSQTRDTAVVV